MLKRKDKFKIVFSGLKVGKHFFEFEIAPEFFEDFEGSIIEKANVHVDVELEKRDNMLLLDFQMAGEIETECARCASEVTIPVKGEEQLIVKFGDPETVEVKDEILWLREGESEIDLSQQLYEYIHLMLPVRAVHKSKKDCDPVVLERLEKMRVKEVEEENETDPRWEELKKLKKD